MGTSLPRLCCYSLEIKIMRDEAAVFSEALGEDSSAEDSLALALHRMRPAHKKIIALSAAGLKNTEIAGIVGISEPWISQILNSPESRLLRDELASDFAMEVFADTRDLIDAHTREAVGTVVHLMRTAKENVRLAAAKDILDRGGFKPQEKVLHTNITLSSNDANDIKQALMDMTAPVTQFSEAEITAAAFTKKELLEVKNNA